MNYNALLLLDKYHKLKNNNDFAPYHKQIYSQHKSSHNINIDSKQNKKIEKYYSVKPSSFMMPKDIIIRDLFKISIQSSKEYIKNEDMNNNGNNINANTDRKNIFKKIKKFIIINRINYNIFTKTIFLYDLICFEIGKISPKNIKYSKFCSLPNMYIALIAFILTLKFNYEGKKIISLKKFVKKFEEKNEIKEFDEVREMEIIALKIIKYNLSFQTPFSFLELFLINGIIFSEDNIHYKLSYNIYELVNETLEKIMETSNEYFYYNYFYLSCSVIMHIREKYRISKWPKALEISFDVNIENFSNVYDYFFNKDNKKESNNKNNIKSFYNADIININKLKNASNIINVLKIMKSADKYRKTKEKISEISLFNNKNEKEENIVDNNNNNTICSNKIKVEKKRWHFFSYKSPQNINIPKSSVSSIIIKINKENEKTINNIKENHNDNNKDNKDMNKNEEKMKIKTMKSEEFIKTKSYKYLENKNNKIEIIKRCKENKNIRSLYDVKKIENKNNEKYENNNKKEKQIESKTIIDENLTKKESFKKSENKINNIYKNYKRFKKSVTNTNYPDNYRNNNIKNNIIYFNCTTNTNNIDSYYSKNSLNRNSYKKSIYLNKQSTIDLMNNNSEINNKEMKTNEFSDKNTINSHNRLNTKHDNKIKSQFSYKNYTEKRKTNFNKNSTSNLNQSSSFNDCLFYKNNIKNNNKNTENEKYFKHIKNKEENSNFQTCESSNLKISTNDFSIRKNYKEKLSNKEIHLDKQLNLSPINEKNKKFEKEGRKILEKNKSYNKLMNNNKIFYSENTYNRRTGVRKYYKQKNSRENHVCFS